MGVHPVPSAFEARSNAVFEAVMWALARPGQMRGLPGIGMEQFVEALIDRECRVHCGDETLAGLVHRAGAQMVAAKAADHIFVDEIVDGLLERLCCGSDLHPEDGATLVARADLATGQPMRLTGPGVDGTLQVSIDGLPADFWHRRGRIMRYPMGFEILLVDGARVLGVPRSTVVEVL